jgi:tRNA nucleotidyltransferase/poly(A) polymerase
MCSLVCRDEIAASHTKNLDYLGSQENQSLKTLFQSLLRLIWINNWGSSPVGSEVHVIQKSIRAARESRRLWASQRNGRCFLSKTESGTEVLLRGDDLITLGLKPGPKFGEILDAVETRQLEGTLRSRDEAIEWLKQEYSLRQKTG